MAKGIKCIRTEKFLSFLSILELEDESRIKLESLVRKHNIFDMFKLKKQLNLKINILRHSNHENRDLKHYLDAYNILAKYEIEMNEQEISNPSLYCHYRR